MLAEEPRFRLETTHVTNEHVNTTNSVTDITNMVAVKHGKKARLRKSATVAVTKSTDDVTNAGTNMFTNAKINASAFASVDTSVDTSVSDEHTNSVLIDATSLETMTRPAHTIIGPPKRAHTPNETTLLTGDPDMSSDTVTKTLGSNGSMESIRRGIWPQLRKDMKRMTHFVRKKVSLSERRNRIKEISIKQQCWEDDDEPETTSRRTSRNSSTAHDADRRSLSAGSSHATSSSIQSTNSTPVVLDDYDEDKDFSDD